MCLHYFCPELAKVFSALAFLAVWRCLPKLAIAFSLTSYLSAETVLSEGFWAISSEAVFSLLFSLYVPVHFFHVTCCNYLRLVYFLLCLVPVEGEFRESRDLICLVYLHLHCLEHALYQEGTQQIQVQKTEWWNGNGIVRCCTYGRHWATYSRKPLLVTSCLGCGMHF